MIDVELGDDETEVKDIPSNCEMRRCLRRLRIRLEHRRFGKMGSLTQLLGSS